MGGNGRRDAARQAANVLGALFQVGTTFLASAAIQEQTGRSTPLIEPAPYAFSIWGVIFALSLAYAAYQALPGNRDSPLLRHIGPFTAAAFLCVGMWSVLVPAGQLLLALAMLAISFVCLLVAYLRVAGSARTRGLSRGERWLVAPAVAIFSGWLTAANVVSLDSEVVRFGLVAGGGLGEGVLGSILLLLGGVLAAAIVLAGKEGPAQGFLAYGVTVLWALVAVGVNHYDASLLTTGTATVAAVLVLAALLRASGSGVTRRSSRSPAI